MPRSWRIASAAERSLTAARALFAKARTRAKWMRSMAISEGSPNSQSIRYASSSWEARPGAVPRPLRTMRRSPVIVHREDSGELVLRVGDAPGVTEPAMELKRLLGPQPLLCGSCAGLRREVSRSRERLRARQGRPIVGLEQVLEAAPPFGEMAPQTPELPDRPAELQGCLRLARGLEPVEGGAEVVVVALEPIEPLFRTHAEDARLRLLDQGEEVLRVSLPQLVRPARLLQPFECVIPDRLQQPEALVRVAEETLVDQRLERVEIRLGDLLRRFERAAAREDGKPREQALFSGRQQLVAPLDRSGESALALGQVSGSAGQERQALLEALQDLRGGECLNARGRQFERERQVI